MWVLTSVYTHCKVPSNLLTLYYGTSDLLLQYNINISMYHICTNIITRIDFPICLCKQGFLTKKLHLYVSTWLLNSQFLDVFIQTVIGNKYKIYCLCSFRENCIIRSFIIYALYHMLLGWSDQGDEMSGDVACIVVIRNTYKILNARDHLEDLD